MLIKLLAQEERRRNTYASVVRIWQVAVKFYAFILLWESIQSVVLPLNVVFCNFRHLVYLFLKEFQKHEAKSCIAFAVDSSTCCGSSRCMCKWFAFTSLFGYLLMPLYDWYVQTRLITVQLYFYKAVFYLSLFCGLEVRALCYCYLQFKKTDFPLFCFRKCTSEQSQNNSLYS